ncbi:cell envelope integrity protein TolA [Methylotenera versatilis]|uniref:cell envelope integrity protein TolA n=1 Tax=Methylotenera versatilis TaxID=1055487 RepID=UPI00064766C9|nr:cell envelope integrity protein TolA [Methylotenera versatilis]
MLRPHESTDSWKAGALAIAVHVFLLGAMLVSFNWKAAHPVLSVTEVELWDKLPSTKPVISEPPKPEPKPIVEEKPEIKPEPKPEPKPVVEEKPKPEEPKVDIELEKKKEELKKKEEIKQKALDEQRKKDVLEKLQKEAREDELREKKALEKKQADALKKMQQDMLSEENAAENKQANAASAAANASVIGEYTDRIKSKIRGNVNKTLCGDGNPELRFTIGLLPTGDFSSAPKLIKSSGNAACDAAVERAIAASEPLPLPSDPAIYAKFRNLNLTFRPNE